MPDRFGTNKARLVEFALILMTAGVVFLTGVVVYALIVGDPGEEKINANVLRVLDRIEEQANDNQRTSQQTSCTSYQNHRAIEEALRDIARLNGIRSGDPRVLPSAGTIDACRAVGVTIGADGLPELGDIGS